MCQAGSVSRWIEGLRAGDQQAASQLWQRFYGRLIRLAKNRLDGFPRRSFDEEDIVTQAICNCFRSVQQGRYPDLSDRHDLWHLLIAITENTLLTHVRREKRRKRGAGRVRGDSVFFSSDGETRGFDQLPGLELTPDFLAQLTENCGRLLAAVSRSDQHRSWQLRQIALWKLEGYNNDEIAENLGCAKRTVERRLQGIRAIWSREAN